MRIVTTDAVGQKINNNNTLTTKRFLTSSINSDTDQVALNNIGIGIASAAVATTSTDVRSGRNKDRRTDRAIQINESAS